MKLPDLDELLALRGVARTLNLHARGPAHALLLGSHRSSHRGRGLEFEEVRPYVAGDDPRSIDWRVTARRGRPHTKLFREERERPVWLLVDLRASMFFGSRLQLKSMVAVRAAALLAWVAAQGGDRIGAVIAGDIIRVLPPRSREAGALPILGHLLELQPRAPGSAAPRTHDMLQTLVPLVHPGSLVLALGDFADLDTASEALWSGLVAHSECRWFWITDALEQHGLPAGRFRAGVPNRVWSFDGSHVRPAWLSAWATRQANIRECAQRLRVALTQLDTSQHVEEAMQLLLHEPKSAA